MDVERHMEMYSKTAPTWSNGQPGATGPPPPPASPFVPSSAQDTLHYLNDCRHHEPGIPTPGQGQRLHSFAATPYQPFGPSPGPVVKRGQSTAELAQMQYYGPRSRDITHSHINSYPAIDPNQQNLPYNTTSLPPMTTQPSLPALAYPPRYEYPSEPSTTKRKRARTSRVNIIQLLSSQLILLTFLRLAPPAELPRRNAMTPNPAACAKRRKLNAYGSLRNLNSRSDSMAYTLYLSNALLPVTGFRPSSVKGWTSFWKCAHLRRKK